MKVNIFDIKGNSLQLISWDNELPKVGDYIYINSIDVSAIVLKRSFDMKNSTVYITIDVEINKL